MQEKVRSRVKSIKSSRKNQCYSDDKVTYQDRYEEIKNKKVVTFRATGKDDQESVIEAEQQGQGDIAHTPFGLKHYDKIKKYSKVVSYLAGKNDARDNPKTGDRGLQRTFYSVQIRKNQSSTLSPRKMRETRANTQSVWHFEEKDSNKKVENIMKKWRPVGQSCKSILKKAKFDINKSMNLRSNTDSMQEKQRKFSCTFYSHG